MHRKVLLLDDSSERADQCRAALGEIPDFTYHLVHAASGSEGLALFESERPDCILISWSLPGNGAVATLHRLRSRHPYAPVIMLTDADELSYQLEEMKSTGECDVRRTDITPVALGSAIDQAIHESETRRTGARIAALSHVILIIDDNPDDRELCARALTSADERYRIIEAESGEAGLALVEQRRPDCVLLDYSLPGLSGLGILKRIHTIDAFLPVIMLTGQGDEAIAVQAMKAGAQNYLPKSALTPPLLQQAVVSAIQHVELEAQIAAQREQLYEQRLALAETNRLMSAVLDSAPCLILVTDKTGKVMVFNKELERVLGYSAQEVIGKHTPLLWSPGAPILKRAEALTRRKAEDNDGAELVDGPGPDRFAAREATFVRKDGSSFPVSLWIRDLCNSEGQIVGFLGLGEDITERKARLEALQTSEETFRSVMEYAPCGMAVIDPRGRFLKVNRALCDIAGRDQAALSQTTIQTLTHPDDADGDDRKRQQLLNGEIAGYASEMRLINSDGVAVDVQLNLSLVRGANARPHYFVAQIQDIRERKAIERLKNEFIAVLSHELRTPLTSIRGSLGLLSTAILHENPSKMHHLVGIARRNCERLIQLINDIMDISKLEEKHMRIERRRAALDALICDAVEANRGYAEDFKVKLSLDPPPGGIVVNVDPMRFVQVLSNFISNAAKFSPPGEEVRIATALQGGRVRVEVSDHGPGIPESFRSRLFEKFSQADTSSTRRAGGSGLGLYICKQLAEHMEGRIGVETAEGQGSTFWIELPAEQDEHSAMLNTTRH